MLGEMIRIQVIMATRRRLVWVVAGLVAFYAALFTFTQGWPLLGQPFPMAHLVRRSTWPVALLEMLNVTAGNLLMGMAIITVVGAMTAQEYRWRTVHLWLSRGASNGQFLVAKLVGLAPVLIVLLLTPLLVGSLVSAYFTTQLIPGSLPWQRIDAIALLASWGRMAFTALPYVALTVLLAVTTRSAVATVGAGIGYLILLEQIAGNLLRRAGETPGWVSACLPGRMVDSLVAANAVGASATYVGEYGPGHYLLDPALASIGLGLYTIVFLGLAWWVLHRQDLAA